MLVSFLMMLRICDTPVTRRYEALFQVSVRCFARQTVFNVHHLFYRIVPYDYIHEEQRKMSIGCFLGTFIFQDVFSYADAEPLNNLPQRR